MSFTKILCPIDFSAGSRQAMQFAVRLAGQAHAELVLFHASFVPATAFSLEAPFPPYLIQDMADEGQRLLDESVRDAIAAGAKNTSSVMAIGVPWTMIVAQLEKQAFDLCVIGTHGRTGLARVVMGSVASAVIRHAPCSVLAVRPDNDIGELKHVLVPTDFSESAMHAVELAAGMVAADGEITLLHVLDLPVAFTGQVGAELARELDRRSAAALESVAARMKTARVNPRTRIGYPGAQTLRFLEEDPSVDLVVMGSHGRTGIKRILLGSVAEKVVRHARCPVLVARTR